VCYPPDAAYIVNTGQRFIKHRVDSSSARGDADILLGFDDSPEFFARHDEPNRLSRNRLGLEAAAEFSLLPEPDNRTRWVSTRS
jgi:hypothetical protein